MHPDMNNFLDITAIDTADQLAVRLHIVRHGNPYCHFRINNVDLYTGAGDNQFNFKLDLLEPISIDANMVDPNAGALEIIKFSINGLEVLPLYLQQASSPTTWINQKGLWYFIIPGPFYPWYHNITGQGFIA
jgi:hypothetical protein